MKTAPPMDQKIITSQQSEEISLSNTVLFIVCYYFFRFAGLIRKFLQDTKVGGGRGRRQEEAAAADSFLNRLSFVAENEEENSENKVSGVRLETWS